MIELLIFFIAVSLVLYGVLGGADYGAGILELFKGKEQRSEQVHLIQKAMGPVWEANHIWLIIIVVILFMGFPGIYLPVSIYLHIPLIAILIGIVLRGVAFTFRHYDPDGDSRLELYSLMFALSSLWTSIWLGITLASLSRGGFSSSSLDFYTQFISPWYGLYPLTVGIFVALAFSFLASIFLTVEAQNRELKNIFLKRAKWSQVLLVISGAFVFLSSYLEGLDLIDSFLKHPVSIVSLILASLCLPLLWSLMGSTHIWRVRVLSSAQVFFILAGWFALHYPNVISFDNGTNIDFYEAAAPTATLFQLNLALVVGVTIIFPFLFFLIKVFKQKEDLK